MMPDEDDHDLLRAWREEAREVPGDLLDRRVLKAAQAQRARRTALPLAAALAACLALVLFAERPQQETMTARVPVARPVAALGFDGTAAMLADPDAMRQSAYRNMPGGSAGQDASS